jgi:hypothetical protein
VLRPLRSRKTRGKCPGPVLVPSPSSVEKGLRRPISANSGEVRTAGLPNRIIPDRTRECGKLNGRATWWRSDQVNLSPGSSIPFSI